MAIGVASWAFRQQWAGVDGAGLTYASIAWGTEILIALALLPLCAARLRDIGWPAALSILVLTVPVFSPRLIAVASLARGDSLSVPGYVANLMSVVAIVQLIALAVLFLRKGQDSETA